MNRFVFFIRLSACFFFLICFASDVYGSSQPSHTLHACKIIDFEAMRRRFSAPKRALQGNVGAPRTVRMIYFLPNDRPFQQEVVVDAMKGTIRQTQAFYARQMQARGYGNKTFRFEANAQGNPVVHRVDGQHPDSFYHDDRQIWDEIYNVFDARANNVYFGVFDISQSTESRIFGPFAGRGGGGRNGGFLYVPGEFRWTTVAHELGHAFGLQHDFNNDAYIMSYGHDQRFSLSTCHAEFLAVHPYFNSDIADRETPGPTIELISPPEYPTGASSTSIQLKVSDSDGLHQLILFLWTKKPHPSAGFLEVKACRGLNGERDAIVEFDYDGVIPSDGVKRVSNTIQEVRVLGIDINGYVGREDFTLADVSLFPPIVTLKGHTDEVNSVALSFDGSTLASASRDGTAKLWDVVTQQEIATLAGQAHSVAFSPDGAILASGSANNTIKLWDVATQQEIVTLAGHTDKVNFFAFSPDGSTLTSISTGSEMAFSPDGPRSVSGSRLGGTVKRWDIATQQQIATFDMNRENGYILCVAFSPDGATLASGSANNAIKLWDVATGRNIASFFDTAWILSMAFSPDGKILASGSANNTIKLWDVATEQEIATLAGHNKAVLSVAFSPDGATLASGSRREIKLWDVATRRNISTFFHFKHTDWINSVAFSLTGSTLASGDKDGTVLLSDMSQYVTPVVFIPDVNLRAAIWDALGKPRFAPITMMDMASLTTLDASHRNIRNVAGLEFATNLTELNLVGNPLGYLSLTTHIPVLQNEGIKVLFEKPTTLVKISGDEQEGVPGATLANPLVVEVRDQNGNVLKGTQVTFAVTEGTGTLSVETAMTDAAGKATSILTLGSGPGTTIVEVTASGLVPVTFTVNLLTPATLVKISGDEQEGAIGAALATPLTVEVRDQNGNLLKGAQVTFAVTEGTGTLSVRTTQTDATGKATSVLTLGSNPQTTIVEVIVHGLEPVTFTANIIMPTTLKHTDAIHSVAYSPDGTMLASGSVEGKIALWDVATKKNIATLETYPVTSVAFSPDGTTLASGSGNFSVYSPSRISYSTPSAGNTITLWDVATRKNIARLETRNSPVISIAYSPDRTMLASGSVEGKITLWDVATKKNIATIEAHTDGFINRIHSVAFSPDGKILASGSKDNTVKLWNIATRRNIATLEGHTVAFSPDGTMLASGSVFGTVNLWDVATRKNIATIETSTIFSLNSVNSVAFSPDGRMLVSGSEDGTVKLWNVEARREITTLKGHPNWVYSVAFSPTGSTLASADEGGRVLLWKIAQGAQTLVKISGDEQEGAPGATLPNPLVVEVRDPYGHILAGIQVVFAVTTGDGKLSVETAMTNATGRAESTLTLGSGPGTTIVEVTASGLVPVTFTVDLLAPATLVKISGDEQEGVPGATLANPLVVEVRDQNGNVLKGTQVTFAVTEGEGTLSIGTTQTDATGRAESTLTLGRNSGPHIVSVTAVGIEEPVMFVSTALATSDFSGDGRVDFSDFLLFAGQFGASQGDQGYDARYDLDGDGVIGFGDFLIFVNNFGKKGS